ncbi:hypothetical protein NQ176_g4686 [Zarea fungicola]|uniref:Uncharacterized protein n=1 Tax=Zarea fungicola TaxID=93591 RepID=A0ACC1NCY1_9HYPO|nr:hypothetical protein NQ176_g4686 [Lecanicillium fungicola]
MESQEPIQPTTVPLDKLRALPQTVECPHCHNIVKTSVQGRGKGMQRFMNVMFWPLPDRRYWWETMTWRCGECEAALATQKNGKDLKVLK